jgi:hypothetical protein
VVGGSVENGLSNYKQDQQQQQQQQEQQAMSGVVESRREDEGPTTKGKGLASEVLSEQRRINITVRTTTRR